jgi:hypothetical protein
MSEVEHPATNEVVNHDEAWSLAHYKRENSNLARCYIAMTAERDRLREALVHSVTVIQGWHNMGVPEKQRSELWDIYWRNAPELKPIRAALEGTK